MVRENALMLRLCFASIFSHKFHWTKTEPGHRDEIIVTNRLKYGVRPVFSLIKIFIIYFVKFMLRQYS
jgi:hypothetical protein